ncbi:MAG: carboxypeptidase-like regulatory domain-containing protein, partial [Bacteroidota bacterium]
MSGLLGPLGLWGQLSTIMVSEDFNQQSLAQVLEHLAQKHQLVFAYDETALQAMRVKQAVKTVPLDAFLTQLLRDHQLSYQMTAANQILIGPAPTEAYFTLNDLWISGKVIDAESGAALPYATIVCDQDRGTSTDGNGQFSWHTYTLRDTLQVQVQYLGYRSQQLQVVVGERPLQLEIALSPKIHAFEQITVLDQVPAFALDNLSNAMVFRPSSSNSLPDFVGGKDLFRSLQLLPGIAAHDDLSAGLEVRGAGSEENFIVLDGMTLYNVGHFFGIFSAINPNIIDQVKIYKNAFPIEYGAHTASVIEMETTSLRRREVEAGVELNLLTSNAYVHTPISPKMDLLVAGRITNQNLGNTTYFDLLDQQQINPLREEDNNSTLSRKPLVSAV